MLKATISIHDGSDIGKYSKLNAFLKQKSENYMPEISKVLTREEIDKFLIEAPDETFLMIKVSLIISLAGACTRDELTQLSVDDMEDSGISLTVTLTDPNNKTQRMFTISNNEQQVPNYYSIYKKYAKLRPKIIGHRRFFVCYKSGRCSVKVVGKNVYGKFPRQIASYLKLSQPYLYTGHCFRRSSAPFLAEIGADTTTVKHHKM